MIALFRAFLNTWVARAFFLVLVASFALWGIGDVIRSSGRDTALATVGDRRIEPPEFRDTFRRELAQVMRMMGGRGEPTPIIRKTVAEQSLNRLVTQAAIAEAVGRLGIVVPDDALRRAVFDIPNFRGRGGTFDRAVFETVMRNNDLTEGRFLELLRSDMAQRQLMETVQAGIAAPASLVGQIYAAQHEQRTGEIVELPFAVATPPPEPSAEDLQRQYENDPAAYSTPATRRVKIVVLSPETVARGLEVAPDEIQAYYDSHKPDYQTEERRAAQVVLAPDAARAQALAAAWTAGADWAAIQAQTQAAGGSAVAVEPSTRSQFPSPELAAAVFAAAPDTVGAPIQTPFGVQIVRVTTVEPGQSRSLDQARDDIRQAVARDRAVEEVYTRANKLDDALSAGTALDDLPGDLGLGAVEGTLDAQGNTPDGGPAPIPGSPALRQAILLAAFAAKSGEPPRMVEGPGQSYYALQVEAVTEPKLKPFDDIQAELREDWVQAQHRREQNVQAAKLMAAAQASGSLDDAAVIAGLQLSRTQPVTRTGTAEGVAVPVQEALFRLKKGETTMLEAPEGFLVLRLADIAQPDPATDPAGTTQTRDALTKSLDNDVEIVFAAALRERAQPRINRTLLDTLVE